MNIVKFIKQMQSLNADNLEILENALRTKWLATKVGSQEEAHIKAQMEIVHGLLAKKKRHHW